MLERAISVMVAVDESFGYGHAVSPAFGHRNNVGGCLQWRASDPRVVAD